MEGKITLITPPDIFENASTGILFMDLSTKDQDAISKWLSNEQLSKDFNFYIYSGEPNVSWLLWALGICQYKYIDIDHGSDVGKSLHGYILSKSNVFYKTSNENLAAIYSHINNCRITQVESFLERAFRD